MNLRANRTRMPKEWQEGYDAASREQSFRDYCPYSFNKVGVDQRVFDAQWRPKLNSWFAGWKAWLDERGLGFNFQPIKKRIQKHESPS